MFKKFILFLIQIIESIEYKNLNINQDDISKKILYSIDSQDIKVLTDTGFESTSEIHLTQPYNIHKIVTENGKNLEGADNHIVFDENMNEVFMGELKNGDKIQTKDGIEVIKSVKIGKKSVSMFDISVESKNHRYYTNDILSHNTISSALFLAWYTCFHYDRNVLVIANKMATTIEIMDKILIIIRKLPFFLKPGTVSFGKTGATFDNNVRIFSQSTTKTAAIGFTIHLLYADEFAHIPNTLIRDFYRSVYPTLSSSKISKIIISSTPNGMNLFYEIYAKALQHKNNYAAIRVDWWEVPGRDEQWRDTEIANLGSIELFNQEYGNMFLASNKMLLSERNMNFIQRIVTPFVHKEVYDFDEWDFNYKDLTWQPDFNPNRIKSFDRFVLSIDVADGVGGDYSVVNIFQLVIMSKARIRKNKNYFDESGFFALKQVGKFRSNILSPEEFSNVIEKLLFDLFNEEKTRVVIEINFKGHLIFERLSKHLRFYPEIFMHTTHSQASFIAKPGIKIKKDNREILIRELRRLLTNMKVIVQDKQTFEELGSFGLNKAGKYEAQTGNDDVAMTCVLLVEYFNNQAFYEDIEEIIDLQYPELLNIMNKKLDDLPEEVINGKDFVYWTKQLNAGFN